MSNTARNYTIRLSAAGHRQLEQDLKSLGASGERSLRRIQGAARPASTGMRETDRAAREPRVDALAVEDVGADVRAEHRIGFGHDCKTDRTGLIGVPPALRRRWAR